MGTLGGLETFAWFLDTQSALLGEKDSSSFHETPFIKKLESQMELILLNLGLIDNGWDWS